MTRWLVRCSARRPPLCWRLCAEEGVGRPGFPGRSIELPVVDHVLDAVADAQKSSAEFDARDNRPSNRFFVDSRIGADAHGGCDLITYSSILYSDRPLARWLRSRSGRNRPRVAVVGTDRAPAGRSSPPGVRPKGWRNARRVKSTLAGSSTRRDGVLHDLLPLRAGAGGSTRGSA